MLHKSLIGYIQKVARGRRFIPGTVHSKDELTLQRFPEDSCVELYYNVQLFIVLHTPPVYFFFPR